MNSDLIGTKNTWYPDLNYSLWVGLLSSSTGLRKLLHMDEGDDNFELGNPDEIPIPWLYILHKDQ